MKTSSRLSFSEAWSKGTKRQSDICFIIQNFLTSKYCATLNLIIVQFLPEDWKLYIWGTAVNFLVHELIKFILLYLAAAKVSMLIIFGHDRSWRRIPSLALSISLSWSCSFIHSIIYVCVGFHNMTMANNIVIIYNSMSTWSYHYTKHPFLWPILCIINPQLLSCDN